MFDLDPPARNGPDVIPVEVLAEAFEQAPVGLGVCDEDGRFLAVNRALTELLGRPRSAVVGRSFQAFVHPDERAVSMSGYFASVVAAASQPPRRAAHAELRYISGDGSARWLAVTWTITTPDPEGRQHGIVHLSDVTDQKTRPRQLD